MESWAGPIHCRQFVLGPQAAEARNMVERETGGGLVLSAHSSLMTCRVERVEIRLVLIGHILDPQHPERGDTEVLEHIADDAADFDSLEAVLARHGGRWLLWVLRGRTVRLYPDAAGTKSAFFIVSDDQQVWAASQPALLAEALKLARDEPTWRRFHAHPTNASSWPGETTPYPGVRQLLPNHYLDLRTGTTHRFWPKTPVAHRSVEAAASVMADRLHGLMSAAAARGSAATPLTGGYDSRTLFACARDLRSTMRFFSIRGFHLPHHDFSLPKRLARRFDVPMHVVRPQPYSRQFWSTLQHNVGHMWWDAGEYMIYTFGQLGVRFVLLGMISEITRCFYYEDGHHPTDLTPERLADLARYQGHPMAVEAFARWLADVPTAMNVNLLDLFYWEHRAGNWASMTCTAFDTVVEPISPYNCRELLEAGLGVDVRFRRSPYALHREICRLAAPATLEVPFNESRLDQLIEAVRGWVPWRIRHAYHKARMRIAGFES